MGGRGGHVFMGPAPTNRTSLNGRGPMSTGYADGVIRGRRDCHGVLGELWGLCWWGRLLRSQPGLSGVELLTGGNLYQLLPASPSCIRRR